VPVIVCARDPMGRPGRLRDMKSASARLLFDMSLSHLKRRRRQTAVSMLGIMMGVGAYIAISAMMLGFQSDFIRRVIDVSPHIAMLDEFRNPPQQPVLRQFPDATVEIAGLRPKQELRGIRNPGSHLARLAAIPGVKAAPNLRGQAVMRYGSTDVAVTIIGIEPELERRVSNIEKDLVAGRLSALKTTANGVILGVGLARKLGISMHDTLSVVSPSGVVLRMKVAGLLRTGITSIDSFQAFALLKKVQILEKRANIINRIHMRLDDVSRAQSVAARIERLHGYRTESWEEANQDILGLFVVQRAIMFSVVSAILIVAGFGIFNIISTIIHEKSRDIAILKSIGFRERDLRGMFVFEGALLGLAGVALGWILGFAIIEAMAQVRFTMDVIVALEGFVLERWYGHYLISGTMAVVTAAAAAYLPARQAAKLDPVAILRGGQ
jgi:lipoprotein-releasing system permease protein